MRAILDQDIILRLTMKNDQGVEIGSIPKGIGFDRLRYDGNEVVDIGTLNQLWVDKNKAFHCRDVGGCQLVDMTYADRYNLIMSDVGWRLKTPEEIINERQIKNEDKINNKLKQKIRIEYSSEVQYKIARDKCFWILVDYALTGNLKKQSFLQNNLDKVKNILNIL